MNQLCEMLGIQYPIIQGGMGNISNAVLTASVSNAGGLGTLGVGTLNPDEVEGMIKEALKLTEKPIALNIPINVTPYLQEIINLIISYKIPVVSLSAGNPSKIIPILKEKQVKILSVVGTTKQAVKAEKLGVDIIVAEGYEAAGINSTFESTTITLIPQIVDRVSIPVVAAGGIADGRGLAAVLMLGACGIQMGTRFIATKEAPFHDHYKQRVIDASDIDTRIVGRSVGKIRRLLHTPSVDSLIDLEKKGVSLEEFEEVTSERHHKIGALEGDLRSGFINGGQISGLISDLPTVENLLEGIISDAKSRISLMNKKMK
ncbi:nitronate monooxygenase [Bacillus timonensis]|nr:nitronate monooxygenase [Bacillus timonensis]